MLIPATNRKTHLPAPAYAWAIICIPLNCMKKGWPGSSENPSAFIILPNRSASAIEGQPVWAYR